MNHLLNMEYRTKSTSTAFTLIELVLYVGIMSIILITTSLSLDTLVKAEAKSRTVAEVEQQGLSSMDIITRLIRNADSINSPSIGTNSSVLSLSVDALLNPTIVRVSDGVLEVKEGVGEYVALTNDRVTVSGFEVQNLSYPSTPETMHITFTVTYQSDSGQGEYSYAKVFNSSANIRTQ